MKTKIVYISGGETFAMADIRDAFDQVRQTLNLDNDTVMFGVPVDADSALGESAPSVTDDDVVCETVSDDTDAIDTDTATIPSVAETVPLRATKHVRKKQNESQNETPTPISQDDNIDTNQTESAQDTETSEPRVVSILSVLTTKDDAISDTCDNTVEPESNPNEITDEINVDNIPDENDNNLDTDIDNENKTDSEPEIDDNDIKPNESDTETTDDTIDDDDDTIHNMLTDAAPVEQTLEELLEKMAPLGEDSATFEHMIAPESDVTDVVMNGEETSKSVDTTDDTDETLARLATEFAENQDNIPVSPVKNAGRGRIGKLKNILPFKKTHHEDSGLMGDLFGWAGIAANDEDFTIPGFFTNAASKKVN